MPVRKSKVKSQPIRQAQGEKSKLQVKSKKLRIKKSAQKTQNTRKVRKSDASDIQKIRRSEFSESSGHRLGGSLSVDLYDVKGKVAGKVSLPKEIFGAKVNPVLMAQAVRVYLANQRKGTASTKTRGEVVASTRKIYRQKGTGRARHGAISAPIFVGGGVVFGPKPRDFSLQLPKKMRRRALASALTSKLADKAIKVVDGLEKLTPKTKVMYAALNALSQKSTHSARASTELSRMSSGREGKRQKILLVIPERVELVSRAARNIEGVTIRPANLLNTYEVLNSQTLLFMKDAVAKLEDTWTQRVS